MSEKFQRQFYHYDLPSELIAQGPVSPRDHSRLLFYADGQVQEHSQFYKLNDFLPKNALIIGNQSRVYPARLRGQKSSGGKVQILCHKMEQWVVTPAGLIVDVLVGANHRKRQGDRYHFPEEIVGVLDITDTGMRLAFSAFQDVASFVHYLGRAGEVPLPPYIKGQRATDEQDYQTCYAKKDFFSEHLSSSCAAPTAGLHFTTALQEQLQAAGHEFAYLTLNVGLGTFTPMTVDDIRQHPMHYEMYHLTAELAAKLNDALLQQRPIIAVGTTVVRALTASFEVNSKKFISTDAQGALTNIFVHPGSDLERVPSLFLSGLITNFHLPESSLFMLVSALIGTSQAKSLYTEAVAEKYRFFSYGDASFLKLSAGVELQ